MTASRHQRLRELFDGALDLAPTERDAWLDARCGADRELRHEVEALLALDEPTADLGVPPFVARPEPEPPPERIGPYQLGKKLGEGGFGEVWEAQQEAPIRRRVALKLMRAGLASAEHLARFELERQALARLEHPGVARILDAGATETGRLYFVMELVEGEAITRFCDTERLGVEARLALFVAVCRAVEHAHRRGLIHRDLKPSNVLVTRGEEGAHPKVIDFGVAKVVGEGALEEALVTRAGQLVGTPEYMSPEQADLGGTDVDTRADVYALGVLLYELLTGRLPHEPEHGGALVETLRAVREEEAPRPSTRLRQSGARADALAAARRTHPQRLRRLLARDLDWVVLRALEKDRERRYGSAAELAADVERYLAHEPVLAGPPSALHRGLKYLRRHRVPLGVGAALLFATTLAAIQANRQRVLAEEQRALAEERRAIAEAQREESEAVSDFLAGTLGASDPNRDGRGVTVVELLERAVRDDLAAFDDQPRVRARLMHTIGEVYTRLGVTEPAEDLLTRALDWRRRELGEDDPRSADTHNLLGILYKDQGRFDEALEHYRSALAIFVAQHGERSPMAAQMHNNIAVVLGHQGLREEARASLELALELRIETLGADHPRVASTLANLGGSYLRAGQLQEARDAYERALAIFEAHHGPEGFALAGVLSDLGKILPYFGEGERGLRMIERSLAIREAALGPDHPDVGLALHSLARATESVQGAAESRPFYERLLPLWERTLGPEHPNTLTARTDLAICLGEAGDYAAAAEVLETSLAHTEARYGTDDVEVAYPLYYLGLARRELGELDVARRHLERALALNETAEPVSPDVAAVCEGLALVAEDRGDVETATRYRDRMQSVLAALEGEE